MSRDPVDEAIKQLELQRIRQLELERIRLVPPPGGLHTRRRYLSPVTLVEAAEHRAELAAAISELDDADDRVRDEHGRYGYAAPDVAALVHAEAPTEPRKRGPQGD